jgi:hypothetical protein
VLTPVRRTAATILFLSPPKIAVTAESLVSFATSIRVGETVHLRRRRAATDAATTMPFPSVTSDALSPP